jgi:hypothetical protein
MFSSAESADLSLAAGELGKKKLVTVGFRYDFTQNRRRLPVRIVSVKIPLKGLCSGLLEGFSKLVRNFKGAS